MITKKQEAVEVEEEIVLTKEGLYDVIRPVIDPDIGISIVDLGLIYDILIEDSGMIEVEMTMTTPACPYGPQLVGEVEYMLRQTKGVNDVHVEIVWDPPWSIDKMDEATRLNLGLDL